MSEKICWACNKKNDIDSKFCVFCGASLETSVERSITITRRMENKSTDLTQKIEEKFIASSDIPQNGIAFFMMGNTNPIAFRDEKEFILGRKSAASSSDTLLDLTPYGGYEYGVSHRHALVRQTQRGYEIIDLESTNGTNVNKKLLSPNKAYPIMSGAQIRLGRLILFAIYKEKE